MNDIRVTVTYEKPTTSKFDALMEEYAAAKRYADATVAYYKPLADVAEDAKFDAILEQLETIKEYARRIGKITNEPVWITQWVGPSRFDVHYNVDGAIKVKYGGREFSKERAQRDRNTFFDGYNLIGRWEELMVYDALEKCAFRLLKEAIEKQKNRAEYEQQRLHNMTKEVM